MLCKYQKFLAFSTLFAAPAIGLAESTPCCESGTLVYENLFGHPRDLGDWVLEGPGKIGWSAAKMNLAPGAQQAVLQKWIQVGKRPLQGHAEYYDVARDHLYGNLSEVPEALKNDDGKFVGGHIVAWNKAVVLPENYCIEYDFRPLSPIGLAILFFNAQGGDGRDIFSKDLASRHGVFRSYTHGDVRSYHISYWANNATTGIRGTSNLRKNPGFFLLASEEDPTAADLDYSRLQSSFECYRIRLTKESGVISLVVNGKSVLTKEDRRLVQTVTPSASEESNATGGESSLTDTGQVLTGGRFGFRHMVGLDAEYSRIRVFDLNTPTVRARPESNDDR
ncbi:DUF1961 family protein [Pirellulales bacterium]|nr:DUF1961 family protein [Pirellulales bacterium]